MAASSSWESSKILPLTRALRPVCSPRMARLIALLPLPDSPTTPSVWPRRRPNETPSTARTTPSDVVNDTCRSSTARNGRSGTPLIPPTPLTQAF